jgi:hypothetical protein
MVGSTATIQAISARKSPPEILSGGLFEYRD